MNCKTNAWVLKALNFIFIMFSIFCLHIEFHIKVHQDTRRIHNPFINDDTCIGLYQISIALSLYLKHSLSVIKIFVQYISMRHMNLSLKASRYYVTIVTKV